VLDPGAFSDIHFLLASCALPPDVGNGSSATAKFEDAYCDNEGVEAIGNPTANVTVAGGIERQTFTGGGAILYRPGAGAAYYLPSYIWAVYQASALAIGAPVGDIEPAGPPAFYADGSTDFTGQPYQRFEAGFIGKDGGGAPFTANRYYPRIHDVEVTSLASGSEWQLELDVMVDPSPAYDNPIAAANTTVSVQLWREDNTATAPVALGIIGGAAPDLHYQGTIPVDLPEDERVSLIIVATRDVGDDGRSGYFPCDGLVGGRAFHVVETSGSPIAISGQCPAPGEPTLRSRLFPAPASCQWGTSANRDGRMLSSRSTPLTTRGSLRSWSRSMGIRYR
jgi:hypothetical protein